MPIPNRNVRAQSDKRMDGLIMSSSGGDTFKMFISPVEPGENVAIGDFWAVQPSDDIVDELYIYDTDWQTVPFEYKEGSPPSDPSEGLYWALIGAGALRSIYQYRSGSWVNVSDGHNIFKSNNPPPTDGAVWIKTNNTTDNVAEALYEYSSIDGWIEQFVFGGAVSLGNGLEYDANGRLQAKLGAGLEFDANGAIKLAIEPVVNIEYGLVYGR